MAPSKVASPNPDTFIAGGMPDNFDGVITRARYIPWDYDGRTDDEYLFASLTIESENPDDDGFEEFTQNYKCADLDKWAPSADGENPVDLDSEDDEEREGVYAIQMGRQEAFHGGTNWAHFISALLDAGFPSDKLEVDIRCFEGIRGHFNRVPQMKRSGLMDDGKQRDILVCTEFYELVGESKKSSKKSSKKRRSKSSSKSSKSSDEESDEKPSRRSSKKRSSSRRSKKSSGPSDSEIRESVSEAIVTILEENEGEISRRKLPKLISDVFDGPEKAKALRLLNDDDFVSDSEAWEFDADENVLYVPEEE